MENTIDIEIPAFKIQLDKFMGPCNFKGAHMLGVFIDRNPYSVSCYGEMLSHEHLCDHHKAISADECTLLFISLISRVAYGYLNGLLKTNHFQAISEFVEDKNGK